MLYKIMLEVPVEATKDGSQPADQVIPWRPFDVKSGFLHLCTKQQIVTVLNDLFREYTTVYILHIDIPDDRNIAIPEGHTGNKYRSIVQWEPNSIYGQYFPHLFGDLVNEDIVGIQTVTRRDTQSKWVFEPVSE